MKTIWQQPTIWQRKRYADTDGGLADRAMITRMRYQWSDPAVVSLGPGLVPVARPGTKKQNPRIEYRGRVFPGYNQPVKSDLPEKKYMVLAKKGSIVKLLHFGATGYGHNYSAAARDSYLARSAGIPGADDILSANYWARTYLWAGPGKRMLRPPTGERA